MARRSKLSYSILLISLAVFPALFAHGVYGQLRALQAPDMNLSPKFVEDFTSSLIYQSVAVLLLYSAIVRLCVFTGAVKRPGESIVGDDAQDGRSV